MVQFLINEDAVSMEVNGDMVTIVSEIAYGMRVLQTQINAESKKGAYFADMLLAAIEFTLKGESNGNEHFKN